MDNEITKLKAEAYDLLANIQQLQRQLEAKNQEIAQALGQTPVGTSSTGDDSKGSSSGRFDLGKSDSPSSFDSSKKF